MHNLQKPIVGTLVQRYTKNPCLAAGILRNFDNSVYPTLPVSFGGDTICMQSSSALLSGAYARDRGFAIQGVNV